MYIDLQFILDNWFTIGFIVMLFNLHTDWEIVKHSETIPVLLYGVLIVCVFPLTIWCLLVRLFRVK